MGLFSGVAYILSSSLRVDDQELLSSNLDANGATRSSLQDATHIITDTLEFEGWEHAPKHAEVVTPKWAERSIALGKCHMTKYYSADPSMLFSGIDPSDVEVLSAAILALGGQWRQGLTREVTHLFAMGITSEKYLTAIHYQKQTRVKILVPHWFDDVVRLGAATIPTLPYEWPDPKVLQLAPLSPKAKRSHKPPEEKASLYKSVVLGTSEDGEIPGNLGKTAERVDVWKGKRILLSASLGLNPGRREAVVAGVKRHGGVVVDAKNASDEAKKVEDVDVLVTKFRAGTAYFKALKRSGVIVGNLSWLFHVQTIRAVSPPTDQLLHYPTPIEKIEGFDKHEITVTNYTGEAREYLKRMIEVMGAHFTPNMSMQNTVVIAAYKLGTKTDKAAQWSIPIVNHTWLEDCFVNWRNLSVGQEKYVRFSPTCDFSGFLGDKGMGRTVILEDAEHKVPPQALGAPTDSVVEVEEAIAVDENDLGTDSPQPRVKDEAEDVEMADDDAGAEMEEDMSPKRERTVSPSPAPRKRRRSGNAKSDTVEETDSRASNVPAVIGRRSRSQVEVVIPPRSAYVSPRNGGTVKKSASHKLVAPESPVASKKSSPVKMRTPTRRSVPAVEEVEEEEPVSTKRASPKKRKRHVSESESEEEHEEPEKPIPGPSKPKPTKAAQRDRQGSSPPVTTGDAPARGRRSAAQKADEKLRDIMPDVINFQKQMKRGVVVGEWERADKVPEKMDKTKEKEKAKEKLKENAKEKVKEAARRRRSVISTMEAEEEESDEEQPTSKRPGVQIMTTKVQVPEDTKKALIKLGAKFTDKPLECTHLIASAFGRTEKLLSSIAVAPFILRDEWLTKSATQGRFLPEKDYLLEDRETEAKYAFKMAKTLERARKNKGKLLEGKTFYLTQKVDVDKKLMKNIVAAHGGTLLVQAPTYRLVTSKSDRYVISCEDDGSIWRAIAENGVPIYTKELILTGILKQEIAWDDHEFMVAGSY